MAELEAPLIVIFDDTPPSAICPACQWSPIPSKVDAIEQAKDLLRGFYIRTNLLGLPLKRPLIPVAPKAVIVSTGGNLGGAIISLPLIGAARKRWPKAHLAVISNTRHGAEIVKFAGLGDSHHVIPSCTFVNSFINSHLRAVRRELRQLGAEVLIANHNLASIYYLLSPLRIPIRIGHIGCDPFGFGLKGESMFNVQVSSTRGMNWLVSYADLAESMGVDFLGRPEIRVDASLKRQAAQRLKDAGLCAKDRAIAVQASVWEQENFKQWPISLLAKTCVELWKARKLVPVVLGALGQEDTASAIKHAMPEAKVIDLVGKTTPGEAAALLTACSVTIANDSGLMHLSAAVGTPTVAIYGMTDPQITWCYGSDSRHRIIRRPDCRPCYALDPTLPAACADRHCLSRITPKVVIEAVLALVDSTF